MQIEVDANTASIRSDAGKQTARVEDKVNNPRDEVRLGDPTVRDIIRLFRTLAGRVSQLEGEQP